MKKIESSSFLFLLLFAMTSYAHDPDCPEPQIVPGIHSLEEIAGHMDKKVCEEIRVSGMSFLDPNYYFGGQLKVSLMDLMAKSLKEECLRDPEKFKNKMSKTEDPKLTFCYDKSATDGIETDLRGDIYFNYQGVFTQGYFVLNVCKQDENELHKVVIETDGRDARKTAMDKNTSKISLGLDPVAVSNGKPWQGANASVLLLNPTTGTGFSGRYMNLGGMHAFFLDWEAVSEIKKTNNTETTLSAGAGVGALVITEDEIGAAGAHIKVGLDHKICTDRSNLTSLCVKGGVEAGALVSFGVAGGYVLINGAGSIEQRFSHENKNYIFLDVGGRAMAGTAVMSDDKTRSGADAEIIPQATLGIGF